MEASSAATPARRLEKLDYGTRLLTARPALATKSQSVLTPYHQVNPNSGYSVEHGRRVRAAARVPVSRMPVGTPAETAASSPAHARPLGSRLAPARARLQPERATGAQPTDAAPFRSQSRSRNSAEVPSSSARTISAWVTTAVHRKHVTRVVHRCARRSHSSVEPRAHVCARGRTEGLTLDGVECSALGLGEPGEVHWAEMNERAAPVVVQADDRRLAFVAASVLE